MKSALFALIFLATTSVAHAFPGIENFVGSYTYVSGPTDTVGCGNFVIKLNSREDGLEVFHVDQDGYEYRSYEFPYVNMGVQPWQYDWGDGIAKGDQLVQFDGGKVDRLIRVKSLGVVVGKIYSAMYFENYELLKIEYKSTDANIQCVVRKIP